MGKTLTSAAGEFTFKDLPPGKYTVTSANVGAMSAGSAAVTVEAGKTAEAAVKLVLR